MGWGLHDPLRHGWRSGAIRDDFTACHAMPNSAYQTTPSQQIFKYYQSADQLHSTTDQDYLDNDPVVQHRPV